MPLFATVSVVLSDPLCSTQAKLLNLGQQAVAVLGGNQLSEIFLRMDSYGWRLAQPRRACLGGSSTVKTPFKRAPSHLTAQRALPDTGGDVEPSHPSGRTSAGAAR